MPEPKRSRRVTRTARARTGYFAGLLLLAVGLGLALGLGWGLTAAGVGLIAYFTLLYDVDDPAPLDPDAEVRYR
jgi:hypothetical protein